MKLNLSVEQLIRDIVNNIRMDYSDVNIKRLKRCDDYARKNHIVFKLEKRPLYVFRCLCAEEAEELFNEVFVKDDRILKALKEFAKERHFVDAAIKLNNEKKYSPRPMLLLYKTKEQYIKEIIHKYCDYINYKSNGNICGSGKIREMGIGDIDEICGSEFYYDALVKDGTVLKELKEYAIKHGYANAKIEFDSWGKPRFLLYRIDINKK
jgi:hypothetical protein